MNDNENQKEERKYQALESYRDRSLKNEFYSMQRIDLIIISIATGGIIALMNYANLLIENNNSCIADYWYAAFLGFLLTICFNVASQISSHKSNAIEAKWADDEMEKKNGQRSKNSIGTNNLDKWTKVFNISSYVSIGLSILISSIAIAKIIF